jgi:hypothetical protein
MPGCSISGTKFRPAPTDPQGGSLPRRVACGQVPSGCRSSPVPRHVRRARTAHVAGDVTPLLDEINAADASALRPSAHRLTPPRTARSNQLLTQTAASSDQWRRSYTKCTRCRHSPRPESGDCSCPPRIATARHWPVASPLTLLPALRPEPLSQRRCLPPTAYRPRPRCGSGPEHRSRSAHGRARTLASQQVSVSDQHRLVRQRRQAQEPAQPPLSLAGHLGTTQLSGASEQQPLSPGQIPPSGQSCGSSMICGAFRRPPTAKTTLHTA